MNLNNKLCRRLNLINFHIKQDQDQESYNIHIDEWTFSNQKYRKLRNDLYFSQINDFRYKVLIHKEIGKVLK